MLTDKEILVGITEKLKEFLSPEACSVFSAQKVSFGEAP